jgi:uncharacterized protein (TIGR00369 family)
MPDRIKTTDPRITSPFHEHTGFELLEWRENFARLRVVLQPHHLNRHGIAHGGVILALLDEAGGIAGNWCSVPGNIRNSVTVDLTTHFVGRAAGARMTATARVIGGGRSLFFASTEIHDDHGTLVAFGSSTHRRAHGSEHLEGVPFQKHGHD